MEKLFKQVLSVLLVSSLGAVGCSKRSSRTNTPDPKALTAIKVNKDGTQLGESKDTSKNDSETVKESSTEEAKKEKTASELVSAFVQSDSSDNWFTKSPVDDFFTDTDTGKEYAIEGVSAEKVYKELTGIEPQKIIVAVIDNGVDIDHEDLKDLIWTNPGEIAGNGIDDDGNGYVDDIHGWNFLGGYDAAGKPVHLNETTLEVTRELVRMKKLKLAKEAAGESLSLAESDYLEKLSKEVNRAKSEPYENATHFSDLKSQIEKKLNELKALTAKEGEVLNLNLEQLTVAQLEALEEKNDDIKRLKVEIISLFTENGLSDVTRINRLISYYNYIGMLNSSYYYNENFDLRPSIVGDDVDDFSQVSYGNNDVKGPNPDHGSHVAGIIAANRLNGLGIQGIADSVEIMAIRAVPDGDEYDKDVALAVRYAADNGARIINMSFGKGYSPHKSEVDKAFRYAASKGVLIVHAAGNDSDDNNYTPNFPNRKVTVSDSAKIDIAGWIDVGASSSFATEALPANFSNYGTVSVDLFAPGHNITSSTPNNTYESFSGTSMASPAVSGVAALVLSRAPQLTAVELKKALTKSVRTYEGLQVYLPGTANSEPPTLLSFAKLSITGGIVDAYRAIMSLSK